MNKEKAILLPAELYSRIEQRIKAMNFSSVEEYVIFVLEEVLKEEGQQEGKTFSKDEEEEVKKRLRSLGYLD